MQVVHSSMKARFQRDAGIALGPILFIIATLAILAAAIAAGSGSFNASTNTEGNKAKASAIIQVGDNLKVGVDRLTMENGVNYNGWTMAPANTSNNVDLFSPSGGGIAPPSIAMAGNPASDVWYYPQGGIPQLGSYASNAANTLQLAVLNIAPGVCAEINNRANGNAAQMNNPGKDVGNFALPFSSGNIGAPMNANWPAANSGNQLDLRGRPVGCVYNLNGGSTGYYFYEVLYVQ